MESAMTWMWMRVWTAVVLLTTMATACGGGGADDADCTAGFANARIEWTGSYAINDGDCSGASAYMDESGSTQFSPDGTSDEDAVIRYSNFSFRSSGFSSVQSRGYHVGRCEYDRTTHLTDGGGDIYQFTFHTQVDFADSQSRPGCNVVYTLHAVDGSGHCIVYSERCMYQGPGF